MLVGKSHISAFFPLMVNYKIRYIEKVTLCFTCKATPRPAFCEPLENSGNKVRLN